MGNNRDVVNILLLVTIGMFIPFVGSLALVFKIDLFAVEGWVFIFSTFFYFLVIFGIELGVVYVYYTLTNRFAQKSFQKTSMIHKKEK